MIRTEKGRARLAEQDVLAILAALPAPLAERARQVSVLLERVPDPDEESDLLGLFTGPELAEDASEMLPPQITLFLENIWDEAGRIESAFRNEVRITYLHELGHYLGLDEDELMLRGLE